MSSKQEHTDTYLQARNSGGDIDKQFGWYRVAYNRKIRNRGDWYWVWRIFKELVELVLSLLGLHDDEPELELFQIAGLCINMVDKREFND